MRITTNEEHYLAFESINDHQAFQTCFHNFVNNEDSVKAFSYKEGYTAVLVLPQDLYTTDYIPLLEYASRYCEELSAPKDLLLQWYLDHVPGEFTVVRGIHTGNVLRTIDDIESAEKILDAMTFGYAFNFVKSSEPRRDSEVIAVLNKEGWVVLHTDLGRIIHDSDHMRCYGWKQNGNRLYLYSHSSMTPKGYEQTFLNIMKAEDVKDPVVEDGTGRYVISLPTVADLSTPEPTVPEKPVREPSEISDWEVRELLSEPDDTVIMFTVADKDAQLSVEEFLDGSPRVWRDYVRHGDQVKIAFYDIIGALGVVQQLKVIGGVTNMGLALTRL